MNYIIRKLRQEEVKCLDTFLYEAIFIPEGVEAPPMEIINQPELQLYVDGFGTRKGDICFVAESDSLIVAAVKMYKSVGFEIVDENNEEYIMVCKL
ncbi:MAG TPA: hypothetical protein DCP07_05465 [Lachnospiraceae bacterium]|nr:hypothetical protein [Lachnospiraceae bacterium]